MKKIILNKYRSRSCGIIDTSAVEKIYLVESKRLQLILFDEIIKFIEQAKEKDFKINRNLFMFMEKDKKNYVQLKQNIKSLIEEKFAMYEYVKK